MDLNWEAIGAIGEIVGAVAVVFSLLYLSVQMRHNARETEAANRNAMAQRTTDILMQITTDKELTLLFQKGMVAIDSLDESELFRFDMVMYAIFESIETTFSQWQRGAVPDEDWAKRAKELGNYMTRPGPRSFWEKSSANFTESFRNIVDKGEFVATYDFRTERTSSDA